jgi:hypothetical protein
MTDESKEMFVSIITNFVMYLITAWILLLTQPFEPFGYVLSYWEFFFLTWGVRLLVVKRNKTNQN